MPGMKTTRRGAVICAPGLVRFEVWAPHPRTVEVELVGTPPRRYPLVRSDDGTWSGTCEAQAGDEYTYVLDGERRRPDPVSRGQLRGVHGASLVVDPNAFAWTDAGWTGIPLEDHVFYELHVGTFTEGGTFDAAITRLDYLRELGITAVEVMPVASFPGTRNWGYDGVHLYAPQYSYGGPDGFRRFVDAAHARGLAVFLDVVYNHLGPEGNYLREFGPYFTDRHHTPWGDALNFHGPGSEEVRRYFVENAAYWLEEFHIDGLRLDAVQGIFDTSDRHVLAEIAETFQGRARELGRRAHLVAESAFNDAQIVRPRSSGGCGLDGQWVDDFHHAVRTALTGERRGYLAPFGTVGHVAEAFLHGYVQEGEEIRTRRRIPRDTGGVPGCAFTFFTQNHDQVANTSMGKRLVSLCGHEGAKLGAAIMYFSAALPLLFMGEEYGEENPFLFFVDFADPGLIEAVRTGRRREMEELGFDAGTFDPFDAATMERSRLDWDRMGTEPHQSLREYHKRWLALRREHPALHRLDRSSLAAWHDDDASWIVLERKGEGTRLRLYANFARQPSTVPHPKENGLPAHLPTILHATCGGERIAVEPAGVRLPPLAAVLLG